VPLGPVAAAGEINDLSPPRCHAPRPWQAHFAPHCGNVVTDPELRVLSLPGLALVHTHRLEGMQVCGLAADPWGAALAVCDDASESTHVLAWPLPGMPQLE